MQLPQGFQHSNGRLDALNQQNQQQEILRHPQPQGMYHDETDPTKCAAAWRRRQRRRAQRQARSEQKVAGSQMMNPMNTQQGGSTEEQEVPQGELLVGDPRILVLNNDLANEAIELLENGTREERNELLK